MTPAPAIGLFGKLPAEGDFIQRSLPPVFLRAWEAWLGAALLKTRAALAGAWPKAYLLSPPWQFALGPGVIGDSGWAGALASSVDRVGRCYPLTLAVATGPDPVTPARLLAARSITAVLRNGALAMIESQAETDKALAAIGRALAATPPDTSPPLAAPTLRYRDGGGAFATVALERDDAPFEAGLSGDGPSGPASFWWHGRWGERPPAFVAAPALPAPDRTPAFFDGDWSSHGWRATEGGAP